MMAQVTVDDEKSLVNYILELPIEIWADIVATCIVAGISLEDYFRRAIALRHVASVAMRNGMSIGFTTDLEMLDTEIVGIL